MNEYYSTTDKQWHEYKGHFHRDVELRYIKLGYLRCNGRVIRI